MTIHQDPLLDGAIQRIEKLEQDLGAVTALLADLSVRVGTEEIRLANERGANKSDA